MGVGVGVGIQPVYMYLSAFVLRNEERNNIHLFSKICHKIPHWIATHCHIALLVYKSC